jgi:hypothetical protein
MKALTEFKIKFRGYLTRDELTEAQHLINKHYTGDEQANHWVDGNLVSKYPEIEKAKPEYPEAHYNVARGYCGFATIQLMEDGTFRQKSLT